MKLQLHKGLTSKLLRVFVQDTTSTAGAGLTGLAYNSSGLTAYYIREGDATATAITLATATVGTFTSGGFKEIDATDMPGVYELGIPNAALATGSDGVVIMLKGATNMAPVIFEIQLTDWNPDVAQPTNFASLAIDGSGQVTIGTNNDKTGYTLSTTGIDAIMTRAISNSEGSATAPCLHWAIAALANASDIGTPLSTSATLKVYKNDSITTLFSKTLTLASGVNPITAQTKGA